MLQAIQRYQGLHLIAFTHADVTGERRRLMEGGFQMQPVVQLRRPVRIAPDETRQTHIDVLRPQPGQMSEGRVQLLTNHTPELFWRPGTTDHANGAVALTGLTLLVRDTAAVAGRYGRYTARSPMTCGDQQVIRLDRGELRFVAELPPFLREPVPPRAVHAVRLGGSAGSSGHGGSYCGNEACSRSSMRRRDVAESRRTRWAATCDFTRPTTRSLTSAGRAGSR